MPYSLTRHASLCFGLAVAVVFLGNPPTASAQLSRFSPATDNSQFLDFRGAGGQTWQTDIAYDPVNNVYLVVGGFGEIYAQFVDAMASPVSPVLTIIKDTWYSANCPTATYSRDLNGGKGGFLVTWHQTTGGWPAPNQITGQVVSYTDGLVGSWFSISDATQGSSYQQIYAPAAYSVTSQKFLVVWTTTAWTIQGRFVDKDGTPQGSVMLIDDDGGNMWPGVTWNESTNEFGIGYCGWGNSGAYARFRRMSASSALSDRTTFAYGGGTFTSDIAYNNVTSNYVMVWSAGASGMQAAAFDATGTMVGYGLASTELTANQDNIGFAFNPVSQTFLVVGHHDYDDLGVELNQNGAPISAGTRVTAGGTTGAYYPRTTASAIAPHFAVVASLNQKVPAAQIMATSSVNGGSTAPLGTPYSGSSSGGSSSGGSSSGGSSTYGDGTCTTPDPFTSIGGGVCRNGGWLPASMYSGSSSSGSSSGSSGGSSTGGSTSGGSDGTCTTPDPFTSMGGGVCRNGGWLPASLSGSSSSGGSTSISDGTCTIPDPFTSMGGGVCVNGGWLPKGMGGY